MNEKDKKECEKKIEEWRRERVKVFCPLIKDRCKLDCECLNEMRFDNFTGVMGGYCKCYALHGDG